MAKKNLKTIENRETALGLKDAGNYATLICACLDKQPKEGWTTTIMKERLNVEAKFTDKTQKTYEVSEGDVAIIKSCVLGFRWAVKHVDLIAFEEYISQL